MALPPLVAAGELIESSWGNDVVNSLVQRFATLTALKASGAAAGTSAIVLDDPRWGILTRFSVGWCATRADVYSGTTDAEGTVTLASSSFGFSTVNFVNVSGSVTFPGADIANLLGFARVSGANLEFYFFKVTAAGAVNMDASRAVQFTAAINGVLTP